MASTTDHGPPPRDVLEVRELRGPRGGKIFSLRLECGHLVWQRSPARRKGCISCWLRDHGQLTEDFEIICHHCGAPATKECLTIKRAAE